VHITALLRLLAAFGEGRLGEGKRRGRGGDREV